MGEDNASNIKISRLICIEEDTQFKYKKCSEIRGQSRNGYQSLGEEQLKEHEVKLTHDVGA